MSKSIVILGENASYGKCDYCGIEGEELRPYGKDGKLICYNCAMKPENKEEVEKNMVKFLNGEG